MNTSPRPELVRQVTDRRVLRALIAGPRTRPQLAAECAISRVTTAESVRRLMARGLVVAAGLDRGGRGRAGELFELAEDVGCGLAVVAEPGAVTAELVDVGGEVIWSEGWPVGVTVTAEELSDVLGRLREAADQAVSGPVVAVAASIADPVDHRGRTVLLPGSPFLVEPCDVAGILGGGAVVDNDVNWAARAEGSLPQSPESFCYAYLGAGIGGALVDGGVVMRGATGLAGELGYVCTVDGEGRCRPLLDVFVEERLVVGASTVLDVSAIRSALHSGGGDLVRAVEVALSSVAATVGAAEIVIGGPWAELLLARLDAVRVGPSRVLLRRALCDPATGVRQAAADLARQNLFDCL